MPEAVVITESRRMAHVACVGYVQDAKLMLVRATQKPMAPHDALAVAELLTTLLGGCGRLCRLLEIADGLRQARERGNTVDFWRYVAKIEEIAQGNGDGDVTDL